MLPTSSRKAAYPSPTPRDRASQAVCLRSSSRNVPSSAACGLFLGGSWLGSRGGGPVWLLRRAPAWSWEEPSCWSCETVGGVEASLVDRAAPTSVLGAAGEEAEAKACLSPWGGTDYIKLLGGRHAYSLSGLEGNYIAANLRRPLVHPARSLINAPAPSLACGWTGLSCSLK